MANLANIKKFVKSLQVICTRDSDKVLNPSLCLQEILGKILLKRTMCCCCSACGRSLLSETQRGSTTLLITHENVLYLGLLQYHWQLVMMKKVDHGMLKEEIKLSKNAQPMFMQNHQINLKKYPHINM